LSSSSGTAAGLAVAAVEELGAVLESWSPYKMFFISINALLIVARRAFLSSSSFFSSGSVSSCEEDELMRRCKVSFVT